MLLLTFDVEKFLKRLVGASRYIPAAFAAMLLPLASAQSGVVISQVYGGGGNSGATYTNDFIELFNPSSSAVTMTNWHIYYTSAAGTSWASNQTTFSGVIPAQGYFLIKEASQAAVGTALPTADATGTTNMSATAGKVALANDATAPGTATCPAPGAYLLDVVSWGSTATACEGSQAPGFTSGSTQALQRKSFTGNNVSDFQLISPPNPHNSSSTTGGISISTLNPNNVIAGASDTPVTITGVGFAAGAVVNFTGQAALTPSSISATSIAVTIPAAYLAAIGTPSVSVTSGGNTSNSLTFTITTANPTCTETATIAQIQGNGRTSAFVSTTQSNTSQGIVTYKKSNGFFMQMAVGDGDPNTSDAIFVFTSSAPTVNLGDLACVSGTISEYYGGGAVDTTDPENTLTEYSATAVTKISSGNPLPTPIALNPDPAGLWYQLEKYEGMRVTVPSLTVVGPGGVSAIGSNAEADGTYTPSGAFWGVVTGTARPFREPGIEISHPIYVENSTGANYGLLPCCVPLFDTNPERIQIYTGGPGSTVLDVAVNAVVSNLTGVLDVYFGDFELDADATTTPGYVAPTVSNNNLTFTAVPTQNSNELTIATYNLEHFYDDQLNGVGTPFEIVLTTPIYQGRLKKASMAIRNVLKMPDILGVEEAENLATLQALASQINSDAVANGQTNPNYTAFLVEGNDVSGIDVGFLINSNRVTNASVTQYFKTDMYNGSTLTFDRPPLLLTATASNGRTGAPLPVVVIANHLKALPADDPTSASARLKRQAEAQSVAQLIQNQQTANPGALIAVMGDLNSFEFNDGVNDVVGTLEGTPAASNAVVLSNTAVVTPNLTELSGAYLPANQRYSYVESGNAQQLDHILANPNLINRLTRFAIGHLDAEFPESLHYDFTRPERLSDHDPEVAYVSLPAATDISASVAVAGSGFIFNRGTQTYNGTVSVKNTSGSAITGPIQVFVNISGTTLTLVNATGKQGGLLPYITVNGGIAAGATLSVPIQISGTGNITITTKVYSGTL
jgi:uncharacterized protein